MVSANTLAQLAQPGRANNLNAIRLFLALLVIFSHSFPLTSGVEKDPLSFWRGDNASLGRLAVELFFFISGMLVTASWLNCKSMNDYLQRRILRIYPGYLCAVFFSLTVALIFADQPRAELLHRLAGLRDVVALGFGSVSGDWIFPHNPFPHFSNGSLWTISREFQCYLLVAIIGLFCCFRHRRLLLGAALAVAAYYAVCLWRHVPSEMSDRRFLTFFLTGLVTWLWRDKIPVNFGLALAALAIFLCTSRWQPFGVLVMPLAACYLVLWVGYGFRIGFTAWCDRVDLSYGTYLYAFPVQQMLAAVGIKNFLAMFALAVPLTLLLAAASWFIVEKPCLKLKSRKLSDHDPALPTVAS